jgi:hypothetical protein
MSKYNGHKNYETWNVSLWIGNDESLYSIAKSKLNYSDFLDTVLGFESSTPDGVKWDCDCLDYKELDELIRQIQG